jgi:hypothetical protein
MQLEIVTELTKLWNEELGDYEIYMTKMEIRDMRKAYGRPLDEWSGQKMVSPFDDVISTKVVIKKVFKIAAQMNYDMNSIDKIIAYKRISDLEFERCFTWIRGNPIKNAITL